MPDTSPVSLMVAVLLCVALPAWSQDSLPEGNGKQAVQTYCVQCHDLNTVTRAGYHQEGWRNNIHMMINVGATLPQDEIEPVIQYLAKHFPERPKPNAVVIPGSVQVAIKQWVGPPPGSRPHDPLATPDGAIWYTGQFANVLGRLDPPQARSQNIISRHRMQVRMAWLLTKTATSGTRATSKVISASS